MWKTLARKLLPRSLWNRLSGLKSKMFLRLKRRLESSGYAVSRVDDYYSPVNTASQLRSTLERWHRPSELRGLTYDLEEMKQLFLGLLSCYLDEFSVLPPYSAVQNEGFGPGYSAVDALTLYMMVRYLKPKRYIEVGSGLSTYYCSAAARKNAEEGHRLDITCIEPYPFDKLRTLPGIELIPKFVQDVDLALFQRLQADDILFIDSSHMLKIDGDVPFLYLEVLPSLQVGVVTHVHDVPFPYNTPYPPELWVLGREWPMLWNEAMVLQAFLCFNDRFKVTLSTPLIRHSDELFLKTRIPFYETVEQNPNAFSSIWLKRLS